MSRFGLAISLAGVLAIASPLPTAASAATRFTARGSAEQVYVTGLGPGARASLLDRKGRVVAVGDADSLGGLLFRSVSPGTRYRVRVGSQRAESRPLTVLSTRPAPPSQSVYRQSIPSHGYGYITMRDGIRLAIDVHPPEDVSYAVAHPGVTGGPPTGRATPTLIEYSGYGYADPAGPQSGIAILANLMGFTVVDVNMRGTGCSGGAFNYFERLQNLDGYDVIETIAHQPWVLHHKVGMMGISYGGISQLFTAQTDPPDLAAISPLSVIDQTATTTYPGGILNTGFVVPYARDRDHDAQPASRTGGQPWAYQRILHGDRTCKLNQVLHGEAVKQLAELRANSHYVPSVADPLAPITFVNKIRVPVYMACQWTDEQTGGHCPDLAQHLTGTPRKWLTFTNGVHADSLDPQTFNRWCDFLQLYVARRAPIANCSALRAASPVIYQQAFGIAGVTLPADPIQAQPSYGTALAAFEKLPAIRVMFDNGAGGQHPGDPAPAFEQSFPRFPIPGTAARSWYFSAGGALADRTPPRAGADAFTWDASARPLTDFTGPGDGSPGGLWTATPAYRWLSPPAGTAVSYLTGSLGTNTVVIGGGAVHVWVRSSTPNVDLQATISEVRPDGVETFVQDGWVRANERRLDPAKSTLLEPVLSLRARDVTPMPRGRFVEVVIPLYYEGHAYRAGSRIRVTITAPNGDQPIWSFNQTSPNRRAAVAVAFSSRMPSALILPVVPGVRVPTGLPPCPGLRGEPCRRYVPYVDRRASS